MIGKQSGTFIGSFSKGGCNSPTILPKQGLLYLAMGPTMVDSIKLLITPDQLPETLRSIFFDGETRRDDADAYALARVSERLNMEYMIGRGEKLIAVYSTNTPIEIRLKACNYAKVDYGKLFYGVDADGNSVFGTPDIGAYEFRWVKGWNVLYGYDLDGNPVVGDPDIGAYEY